MSFDLARLHALLDNSRFTRLRYTSETGSTNDDALALLGTSDSAGLVLIADYQRQGKGRKARTWCAVPGSSLLFTAILPAAIPVTSLWAVPFWTALGVADGIERVTGIAPTLQWPNDLLLDGRKCCGILAVSRVTGERAWIGCGIGLNVRRPARDTELDGIVPPPAFLSDHATPPEREPLLAAILRAMDERLELLAEPHQVARAWEQRAHLAGTPYRIASDDGRVFDARAQRLENDGSLIVLTEGKQQRVTLADARVVRG